MTVLRCWTRRAIFVVLFLVGIDVSIVCAQSQVRVTRDRATIWRREARIAVTTVRNGTVLDVTGREGDWYVVVIPPENGGKGETGLIAVSQVETVANGQSPRVVPPVQPPGQRPPPATRRPTIVQRPIEIFGFGQAGYGAWLAHDTFGAVLGSSGSPMFGGGGQVRIRHLFIEGSIERFQKTGQRVFVSDGEVFGLGIADKVRIIPLAATIGYRHFHKNRMLTSYIGGGAGATFYHESSDFSDPADDVDEHFASYHILGGVELASRQSLRGAIEVQFTTVPGAFGASGTAAAFGEHNLGGVQVRFKLLFGR
jgi:hypothetical protein